ncbi:MAG: carboxymuconolactone decarboxylase [Deltaproteobacteria bacterium]|nr:carboxymuconolactone decarboxylase [Deltaproteobacteria bacterium]
MRLSEPRLAPLGDEQLPDQVKEVFREGPILNIFRTLAHHPDLMRRWLPFGNHVLAKSTLPARERELVILRIGWLCRAGYEWGQHVLVGLASGLRQEEIDRIPTGSKAEGWNELDRALLDATDELHADAFVSDATWERLDELDPQQRIDLVFTVGQYNLVSMALNTLGVQPEPGLPSLPE